MITSWSPLITSVGCWMAFKYSYGFSRGAPHLDRASLCAGATFSFTSESRFSRRRRKRFRNAAPAAWLVSVASQCTCCHRKSGSAYEAAEDRLRCGGERGHALAAARAGADQHQAAHQLRLGQGQRLRHGAADREAEHVHLLQTQGLDEGGGIGGHALDGSRHLGGAAGHARVVEQDHFLSRREGVR